MRQNQKVHLLYSVSNLHFRLKRWQEDKYPLLFITGLSGAGKTTYCTALAEQYDCIYISLDALRFYDAASLNSRQAVDEFLSLYPDIASAVANHWPKQGLFHQNEQEYATYTRLFVSFLYDRAIQNNQQYIVEGIQLFVRLPKETLLDQPKIILGTSAIKCFCQTIRRENTTLSFRTFFDLAHRFIRYHMVQLIRLNYYIGFWRTIEPLETITKIGNQ